MTDQEILLRYTLIQGDNAMILGHRLSELCGHGPSLETDIACTNISLDFFGQVRSYFQYAAKLSGEEQTEDTIAHFRNEREFYNCILVEQPNTDFAYVICRQFLFDVYHVPYLERLSESDDPTLAAIAQKTIKEAKYHRIFSSQWMKRLGDGTEESHQRINTALQTLYPFHHELFIMTEVEIRANELGYGVDLNEIKTQSLAYMKDVLEEAALTIPDIPDRFARGKEGMHSEYLGPILAEFQSTQRAYPGMQW